jgi:hypothetical protein
MTAVVEKRKTERRSRKMACRIGGATVARVKGEGLRWVMSERGGSRGELQPEPN